LIGPFRETFALVLALIFVGIAIGTWFTRLLQLRLGHILTVNFLGLVWIIIATQAVVRFYAANYSGVVDSYILSLLLKVTTLSLLMGIPALTFGATIPSLITAQNNVAKESGQLLFLSSMANTTGFLLMLFLLHPYLDYGTIILTVIGLTSLALLIYLRFHKTTIVCVVFMLPIILWAYNSSWDENLLFLGHTAFHSREELDSTRQKLNLIDSFKGRQDVFAINRTRNGQAFFFINGYMSIDLENPAEQIVGAFSSLFSPRTDNALVLGTGSGATAGTVGLLFDHMDTVEINPAVLANLHRMRKYNFDIEHRQTVNIIQDDAMRYIKATDKKYSLIINTVTSPLYFSSTKLYTSDFLELIKRCLHSDGIYVTWIDYRIGDRGLDITLKTISQSFKNCWIGYLSPSYFLLICSPNEIALRQPRLVADNQRLSSHFYHKHGFISEWLPYLLLNTNVLDLIEDIHVPVNTLDYPSLEFEMARLRKRGINIFLNRLLGSISVDDIARVIEPVMEWNPDLLAIQASITTGNSIITTNWLYLLNRETADLRQLYDEAVNKRLLSSRKKNR
jgi:predicted membrane-bound spermidine synthase